MPNIGGPAPTAPLSGADLPNTGKTTPHNTPQRSQPAKHWQIDPAKAIQQASNQIMMSRCKP
ncbi:hypothetical protein MCC01989_08870 [Bifidobacteriaceae bacterium MCC01989]|nr:hypothetical protein MCC01989_08870 [Bifidobacteriaceae bacterium MCC01989]